MKSWENRAFKAERPKWSPSGKYKQQIRSLTQQRDREAVGRPAPVLSAQVHCCWLSWFYLQQRNWFNWLADPGLHPRVSIYYGSSPPIFWCWHCWHNSLLLWRSASLAPEDSPTVASWRTTKTPWHSVVFQWRYSLLSLPWGFHFTAEAPNRPWFPQQHEISPAAVPARAGPGQMPTRPQPMPKRIAPKVNVAWVGFIMQHE